MTNKQTAISDTKISLSVGRQTSLIITLTFGVFLLYGVGFAMPSMLHNAAHDTRHSVAFPCH